MSRITKGSALALVLVVAATAALAARLRTANATAPAPAAAVASLQVREPKICWHDDLSRYRCASDSTASAMYGVIPCETGAIREITVSVRPVSGRIVTLVLPGNTDAVFFSRGALENMLVRYYDATGLRARGDSLRALVSTWPSPARPR